MDKCVAHYLEGIEFKDMAINGPKGHGRKGKVKKRAQVLSGRNKRWTKVDAKTGKFMDQMAKKGRAFKSVRMK